MRRLEEQQEARREKRERLEKLGINPYPATSRRTHTLAELREHFDEISKSEKTVHIVGRIQQIRGHGGSTFITITDEHQSFQVYCKKDVLGDSTYDQWIPLIDLGDFFGFSGTLFKTKKDEPTLLVATIAILTKALRPVPEQHFGLKDTETRLRKRYLDLLLHPELRELFRKKSLFWNAVREKLTQAGFLEVETPVLEMVPGGAEAEPFLTHYNALDRDVSLRISLELPLKRLLVGGYERVFEIGRIFRNEGMSPEHLQDYTQMEMYWAFADYHDLMKFLQDLYQHIAITVCGSTTVTNAGRTIDVSKPWEMYDYYEYFEKYTGIDLAKATTENLQIRAKKDGIRFEPFAARGRLIDLLYKQHVRPHLLGPGFLLNPPVDVEPLAKRSPKDAGRVERLQVMMWGTELGKGFSELNDPDDQRSRFEAQMKLREAGDAEAQQLDEDFLEALEYGMPPATGFGMSERVFSYFMDKPIRETVIFPALRGERDSQEKQK